jgi:hypothetical protein
LLRHFPQSAIAKPRWCLWDIGKAILREDQEGIEIMAFSDGELHRWILVGFWLYLEDINGISIWDYKYNILG